MLLLSLAFALCIKSIKLLFFKSQSFNPSISACFQRSLREKVPDDDDACSCGSGCADGTKLCKQLFLGVEERVCEDRSQTGSIGFISKLKKYIHMNAIQTLIKTVNDLCTSFHKTEKEAVEDYGLCPSRLNVFMGTKTRCAPMASR